MSSCTIGLPCVFLSTLSLRRATVLELQCVLGGKYFYPRSPCGERLPSSLRSRLGGVISIHALLAESDLILHMAHLMEHLFLSTLSLRRATLRVLDGSKSSIISIHALLAESDLWDLMGDLSYDNFYPRSPCGERPRERASIKPIFNFYPRSPCGERQSFGNSCTQAVPISIHALLAESDSKIAKKVLTSMYFYPRSPCGERP